MKYYFKALLYNYANFSGRARRSEYWYFFLFNFIISYSVGYLGMITNNIYLGSYYSIAVLIPGIAVFIRRMHDLGRSGWYGLIPIYNIILLATPGDIGPNAYGPDPKEIA
jgi:uncharacterized membrane protein YhaH (DUF805 family)